jgi:peptidyl-prolyl cis-trans isomerase D
MLDAMRTATKGIVGRSLMTIVLGLLIASFAIWGIGDIFRGFKAGDLAKVGKIEIGADTYRNAYQAELQRLQRMSRRPITNEEARLLGIDQQVLQRLIGNAALDQDVRNLGLGLSDAEVLTLVAKEPLFRGLGGQFDRKKFEAILRDNGLSERTYVVEQRGMALRGAIVDALSHGLDVPTAMLKAIHQFQTEKRAIDYIVLPTSIAGPVPDPSEDELKKYFEERQELYGVPEYRSLVTLEITPTSLAKPAEITDVEAEKRYDEVKAERYGTTEKRAVEQIVYPDEASAKAARASLDSGKTFAQLLADKGLTAQDASLGALAQSGFADKNVAAAAFALAGGQVSAPIATPFGTVLVRVTEIIPATMQPYAEVAADLKHEIAVQRARSEVGRLHDKIEDQRAAGKSLAEAAQELGLEPRKIKSIDPVGNDMDNKPVEGTASDASLMKAIFASDVGVDNETLRTRDGGYQWFEVTQVTPARQRGFGEVKPEVLKAWRDDEISKRVSAKAEDVVRRLEGGEPITTIAAAENNLAVQRANDLERSSSGEGIASKAAAPAFNIPVGGTGSVELDDGSRLVFVVVDSKVPPFDAAAPTLTAINGQVKQGLVEDVVGQYLIKLQNDLGVKVNERAFAAALGSRPDAY